MARLMKFKQKIIESLENNDIQKFQEVIKQKLNEKLKEQNKKLLEQIESTVNPEMAMVTKVQNEAKNLGGSNFSYDQGVLVLTVPSEAVEDLSDYLDDCDDVDSYDISDQLGDDGQPVDLNIIQNENMVKEFTIYFVTDNVRFEQTIVHEKMMNDTKDSSNLKKEKPKSKKDESEEDQEEDKSEEDEEDFDEDDEDIEESRQIQYIPGLSEATKSIVFRHGMKQIKMVCPLGQKWLPDEKKCMKITAKENRLRHVAAIKGARKRNAKQGQIEKKRAKTLRKRESAGF